MAFLPKILLHFHVYNSNINAVLTKQVFSFALDINSTSIGPPRVISRTCHSIAQEH